ncbi:peroxisomal membrane family protein [Thecamonas trahens ATCC 50062]|uniref:Peroxisomal membrane family protein n=1 Tax=Thecamonas trahens ATCC 50062 TaxID=461836 RepID=A0A0L0DDT5_THETB|nr:peroxisomal membrane family protein [Thecamonas trahens ATCC 50062]KNC49473.1 peroxisomal membrane family protein [Thecamonas trahens ATCC 50062]|eukprot:XP_013757892.1 peroxisomal membrane family protein [Thecamonas trahens ATCC 50062]
MATATISRLVQRLRSAPQEHPFGFGVVFSTAKTSAADALVQVVVEQREAFDWRRNLGFAAFGCLYLGGLQYAMFVPMFRRLFPYTDEFLAKPLRLRLADTRGWKVVGQQVFVEQALINPYLYFPAFYACKSLVAGEPLAEARARYIANFRNDVLACWAIGLPASTINYTLLPFWLRVPYIACISFFWTAVLSLMRGSEGSSAKDDSGAEAAEAGDSVVAAVCLPASGGARLGLGALTAKQVWRVTAAVDAHQDVVARTQVEAVQGSRGERCAG